MVTRLDPGTRLETYDLVELTRRRDGDDPTGLTGAGRAAGTVQVGLRVGRCVVVDDQTDIVDVDPPGSDIRRDDDLGATARELVQVALAHPLRQVAVQIHGLDATFGECVGELGGTFAGADEHDRTRVRLDERGGCGNLVAEAADDHDVVVHRGD